LGNLIQRSQFELDSTPPSWELMFRVYVIGTEREEVASVRKETAGVDFSILQDAQCLGPQTLSRAHKNVVLSLKIRRKKKNIIQPGLYLFLYQHGHKIFYF
jgi:hypothetical protein